MNVMYIEQTLKLSKSLVSQHIRDSVYLCVRIVSNNKRGLCTYLYSIVDYRGLVSYYSPRQQHTLSQHTAQKTDII